VNVLRAITLTLIASVLFAGMSTFVRYAGEVVPVGQVVFFRAFFAIIPVVLVYAWRGELRDAVRTKRPLGHVGRGLFSIGGMFLNFASLARLPLVEATAISFASPFITVALSAIYLNEHVRLYRWTAVFVGFCGVLVMLWPQFNLSIFSGATYSVAAIGSLCAVGAAVFNSGAVIQTRRLTDSETTASIVFYFSIICAIAGLATLPFGWVWPTPMQLAALIATGIFGGIAHILLTESYRYGPASLVAPFGYTIMLWVFLLGYFVFGEVPHLLVFIGSVIVVGAGLFVIYRERQLGLKRPHEVEGQPGPG
jgi:drug/metabolite transporter (DMT)-like permease